MQKLRVKYARASRALRWAWTPANIGSLRLPNSALLRRQNLGKKFCPPRPDPGSATDFPCALYVVGYF